MKEKLEAPRQVPPERFPRSLFLILFALFTTVGFGLVFAVVISVPNPIFPARPGSLRIPGLGLILLLLCFLAVYKFSGSRKAAWLAGATVVLCALIGGATAWILVS